MMKNPGAYNLSDNQHKTQTQFFIEAYKHVKAQGALDEDKIVEVAQDIARDKLKERYESQKDSIGLVDSFVEAKETKVSATAPSATVDIKGLFE